MKIFQFRKKIHELLDSDYGKDEVESFYFILMQHYLKLNKIKLVLQRENFIDPSDLELLNKAITQLRNSIPIQYIIGQTEFYGLHFMVNKNVLIPRPETEELVDWIIKDNQNIENTLRILDLGTGSGCISIVIAKHIKKSHVIAVDVSSAALEVAKSNADKNKVDVKFMVADIFDLDNNVSLRNGMFDVIVSNPPYVRNLERKKMSQNVLAHEPKLALFVTDEDPLLYYRHICEYAKQHLSANGCLYFEINEYLREEMTILLKQYSFDDIMVKKDIFQKERMIKAIRK